MTLAIVVLVLGRGAICASCFAIAVWVAMMARRRPDVIPRWLSAVAVALLLLLGCAAPLRLFSVAFPAAEPLERWFILATGSVFATVAVGLWTVRFPHIPTMEDLASAKDAERMALARLGDMEREVRRLQDRVAAVDAANRAGWQSEATAAGWTPPGGRA